MGRNFWSGSCSFAPMRTIAKHQFPRVIRIGLVNNMPDGALARTQEQFQSLFRTAAPACELRFRFFFLGSVPRSGEGRKFLSENNYWDAELIDRFPLDAVIVTGTEPRQTELDAEPYWDELRQLLDRMEKSAKPAFFSCLAAHAALQHFDGIKRQRLSRKISGLYCEMPSQFHELTAGMTEPAHVAHSRWNDVSEAVLEKNGYSALTHAEGAGVDLFVRSGRRNWLFLQGHPEYDHGALLREYSRDVRRFLCGKQPHYPDLPANYFADEDAERLEAFRARASVERSIALMESFPRPVQRASRANPTPPAFISRWLSSFENAPSDGRVASARRKGDELPRWAQTSNASRAVISPFQRPV